jgi:hypothetical protein
MKTDTTKATAESAEGTSDVSHKIDLHVTVEGQSRRVLIECKDFDISGDKVGLPIVRNFWAVCWTTRGLMKDL